MIIFAGNYDEVLLLFKPKCIISLFAEYSHIIHATDDVICSETIEDIYNLKIECTSES